jgi:outer membrane protein OmpA-like peptidoglycan-associated protein
MNRDINLVKTLVTTTVASVLLAACATAPIKPEGAAEARNKLTRLQSDPELANRAPLAMKDADAAVRLAEQPEADKDLSAHRIYLADRKVDTAKALADTSLTEDQRATLTAQRESARLDARTREADAAKSQIATARAEGAEERSAADRARSEAGAANSQIATARAEGAEEKLAADRARDEADAANVAAASSERQSAQLQRQIDVLQARKTDRGLVLTLGDVLFASGRADLKASSSGKLNKLVAFLNEQPDRTAAIEGYTDSVGGEDYNQGLSERRAASVKSYLVGQGVNPDRVTASGEGESHPVADNDSAAGRQENRRVEVILNTRATALR